jgi:hypothetical protein
MVASSLCPLGKRSAVPRSEFLLTNKIYAS